MIELVPSGAGGHTAAVDPDDWRPTAPLAMLRRRAELLALTRRFFADREVLEVDTPLIVNAPVTDVHIHSARVTLTDTASHGAPAGEPFFLHTSPEYAMKRLLAAGSGDIYQLCHVARGFERGRLHNPEFTLIEWYRIGFSLQALMTEVDELVRVLLGAKAAARVTQHLTYREAFLREIAIDPFHSSVMELARLAADCGFQGTAETARDEILEFLMATRVGPRLGRDALTFVHAYPASQAALARLDPDDPEAARRFELYCDGVELANGFHELAGATEQRHRFELDRQARRRRGLPAYDPDERLLAALAAGLPDCAGVAVGFDRLVMLATAASCIDDVLAFTTERA